MSITSGYFTAQDGEIVKVSAVVSVGPLVGNNGGQYYNIHLYGGQHITIKEIYFPRDSFLTAWQV
mgnify:CR=1 FL=1